MILDDGICSIFRAANVAAAGRMPVWGFEPVGQSWFKRRSYSTRASFMREGAEDTTVSLRIRILRNDAVTNHDVVILVPADAMLPNVKRYSVINAVHDVDPDSGEAVTDLYLEDGQNDSQ